MDKGQSEPRSSPFPFDQVDTAIGDLHDPLSRIEAPNRHRTVLLALMKRFEYLLRSSFKDDAFLVIYM
ncbi:hypothetical protein [Castellaniella sp.]|uniref:hypothetical protein n=1 Tax=Castellaniella sp. TaxID=1955812 RepID=UPI002AFFA5FD|nr:hypothetical protein [Castellaniella sp.]